MSDTVEDKIVDVVAGVLRQPDGSFFLASRPEGKVYAGYWEFPGGKVEPGEARADALTRELREELGIEVEHATPWLTQVFTYPHAKVCLNFFLVHRWRGEPHPHEGQQFAWQRAGVLDVSPVLPANTPIFRALALPELYAITNAQEWGAAPLLARLEAALERGLRLIQVREKSWPREQQLAFAREVVARARPFGAKVLINGDVTLAHEAGVDGVHLSSGALLAAGERPDLPWVGASCHDLRELEQVARLGLDYALLGPAQPTASHPGQPALGWEAFRALHAHGWPFPIYALGGLAPGDLATAQAHGAHGIAMLRQAW
ncbi:Nudix family hydrolase [Chitinivorax sp. PXF-14]|uniref:Nudix family hydrolase n=1 Tax=Chitinivorax sp. PXF-14 TaxID=3230488 RepID=UPI003465CFB4